MSSVLQVGLQNNSPSGSVAVERPPSGIARTWRRLRLGQIRAAGTLMRDINRVGSLVSLLKAVRNRPVTKQMLNLSAGYNRVFPDLAAARLAVAKFAQGGHDSPENGQALFDFMESTRPSDYPVLHHLGR